jgi:hypothetical protein
VVGRLAWGRRSAKSITLKDCRKSWMKSDRTRFVAAACRNSRRHPEAACNLTLQRKAINPSFDDTRMLCGQDEAANKYKMPHHGQNNIKYAQLLRGLELQATDPSQAQLPSRSDPQRVVLSKLMAYRSPYSVSGDAERRAPTDLT